MTDGSQSESAEQGKKPRRSRASETASDDTKTESPEQDTAQETDDDLQTDNKEGGEQTAAAATKSEQHVAEKQEKAAHAAGEPAKEPGTAGDKTAGSSSRSVYTRFRRRRR